MKISFDNQNVSSNPDEIPWNDGTVSLYNSHWKPVFDSGTIEKGSSGSPLFNEAKRVVGQLHGGGDGSYCPPVYKYYGKFNLSWGGGNTNNTRLKTWLDPLGTNPNYLNECLHPPTISSISGPNSAYHYPNSSSSGSYYSYTASPVFPSNVGNYVWSTIPNTSTLAPNRHECLIRFNAPGSYVVRCHTSTSCSSTSDIVKNVLVTTAGYYSLSQSVSKQIVLTKNELVNNPMTKNTTMTYHLFNQSSSLVANGQISVHGATLNFAHLPDGFYMLQIDLGNNLIDTYKIILK